MSKTNRARALAIASFLVLASASAGPAAAETLADAIALAYQTNPGLLAQRAAVRALDESYVQARAGYGVNASVQANDTYEKVRQAGQIFAATDPTVDLSIAETLYTGGRLHAHLNAAEADIMAARETLRRFELNLMQQVIAAYVGVRRDQALLDINRDTVTVLVQQLADTQARYDVRENTATDVAQSKARLASARTQLASAEGQLAITREQYLALVGQNPGDLAPEPPLEGLPATIDQAFDAGENNNPTLIGAEYTEQASRARVTEARAQGAPTVGVRVDIARAPYLPYLPTPYNDSISVSGTVTQPLFAGGLIASGVRQALQQNNRDRFSIDDAHRGMIQSISEAWEQLTFSRQSLVTQEEEEKADEFAFYGDEEEAKAGLRSTIEILNAALELQQAQLAVVRTRASEYATRAQLLAAMGTLSPKLIAPGLDLYDPADNFKQVRNKGALPWEGPVRALDAIGGLPIERPKPAETPPGKPNMSTSLPPPPG